MSRLLEQQAALRVAANHESPRKIGGWADNVQLGIIFAAVSVGVVALFTLPGRSPRQDSPPRERTTRSAPVVTDLLGPINARRKALSQDQDKLDAYIVVTFLHASKAVEVKRYIDRGHPHAKWKMVAYYELMRDFQKRYPSVTVNMDIVYRIIPAQGSVEETQTEYFLSYYQRIISSTKTSLTTLRGMQR